MKKLFLLCVPVLLAGCASDRPGGADDLVPPPAVENNNAPSADSGAAQDTAQAPVNVSGDTLQPKPWSRPAPVSPNTTQPKYPVAKPVPGKQGVVFSPYAPYAGEVDVREYQPGQPVLCPFTGKPFIVP
ncbi:MAG: hypothetical protein LBK60_05945 [Verrucomicrobiales bacterium]|jgi:hypothetical protein|nr:hypothetical protein [Verrucomicrobiales bacterium]